MVPHLAYHFFLTSQIGNTMELTPEILTEILALKEGEEYWINKSEGGGLYLQRLDNDWFDLYEVPLYGGESRRHKTYHYTSLQNAFLDTFYWT